MWWAEDWFHTTADIKELQKAMTVTLWVDAPDGRHQLSLDALPFEEVITFQFVEEAVVSGFSVWLHGREIMWQRLWFQGMRLQNGDKVDILTKLLCMELLPLVLS